MIRFSKREKDYLISIELKGHFTEDKIESILHLTYKHLKHEIPALYIIDCREFLSPVNQDRIIQFVNSRVVKNYMRYALVVSREVLSRIDLFALNSIKLRNDTEMMIFETPKEAEMWCNSPIPIQYSVVSAPVSEPAAEATKEKSEVQAPQGAATNPRAEAPEERSDTIKAELPIRPVSANNDAEKKVLSMDEINGFFLTSEEKQVIKEENEKKEAEAKRNLKLVNLEGSENEQSTELTPEEIAHAGNTVIKDPHSVYFVSAS